MFQELIITGIETAEKQFIFNHHVQKIILFFLYLKSEKRGSIFEKQDNKAKLLYFFRIFLAQVSVIYLHLVTHLKNVQ